MTPGNAFNLETGLRGLGWGAELATVKQLNCESLCATPDTNDGVAVAVTI